MIDDGISVTILHDVTSEYMIMTYCVNYSVTQKEVDRDC